MREQSARLTPGVLVHCSAEQGWCVKMWTEALKGDPVFPAKHPHDSSGSNKSPSGT